MTDMEKIVRPFQSREVFNARYDAPVREAQPVLGEIPSSSLDEDSYGTIEWGEAGPADYKAWSFGGIAGFTSTWEESSRRTETVRVSNPDDDSQFVDVQRILEMTLKHPDTGQLQAFKFNWPTS